MAVEVAVAEVVVVVLAAAAAAAVAVAVVVAAVAAVVAAVVAVASRVNEHITYLELPGVFLTGTIPSTFAQLKRKGLTQLDLQCKKLSAALPDLDLDFSQYSGDCGLGGPDGCAENADSNQWPWPCPLPSGVSVCPGRIVYCASKSSCKST